MKNHPVHCVKCGKTYRRTQGLLGQCKSCNGTLVWTFTGKTKPKKPAVTVESFGSVMGKSLAAAIKKR